nr:phospholipase-like protein [Tanacetum cinerariifolium]
MFEEENNIKSIDRSNSTHMKLALEKCKTTKRRYVNVLRSPMEVDIEIKGPSMDTLKNQKNVLDAYMIERCQELKPWEEVGYMKSTLIFGYDTCGILDNPVKIGQCQETFDVEIRPWYVKIRRCLESKLPVVQQETGVY